MDITIIAVGKLKEKYLKNGITEYLKRMKSYVNVKIVEVNDEPASQTLSEAEIEQVKEAEGQRIIEKIPDRSQVIALDLKGKQLTSENFEVIIDEKMIYVNSQIY